MTFCKNYSCVRSNNKQSTNIHALDGNVQVTVFAPASQDILASVVLKIIFEGEHTKCDMQNHLETLETKWNLD